MNDKQKIEALCELILNSAPLTWVANGDFNGAADWEKRAVELTWKMDDDLCNDCGSIMMTNYCSKCEKKKPDEA